VGGRYTDETKGIEFNPNPTALAPTVNQFDTAAVVAAGIPVEQSVKIFTPRFVLRYDFTKDLNVYASATRGFRGGGWDARSSTANLALAFAPEKTWSYELGLRSEWLDHKLRANLTGFYADTEHFQLPTAYVPAGGGGDVFITGNYANFTVHGVQAELAAAPIEGLQIFSNIGWQQGAYYDLTSAVTQQQQRCLAEIAADSTTRSDCAAGIINPVGQIAEPTHLPTHSIKTGVLYRIHLGPSVDLIPNANIENSGSYDVDAANVSPDTRQHAYTMLYAGLRLAGVSHGRDSWSVQANCSNCTDRLVITGSLPPTLYYQDPRRWVLTFGYNF
jgi:iron complex outermembrane receptor protein